MRLKGSDRMIKGIWYHGQSDLSHAKAIRQQVFVQEQKVDAELEWDGLDAEAEHLVVYETDQPIGCGRLIKKENDIYYLGRIAVLKEKRGQYIGDFIVRMMVRKAFDAGAKEVQLHGQKRAEEFYKKLGFVSYGETFMEANIPHVHMRKTEDFGNCCGH